MRAHQRTIAVWLVMGTIMGAASAQVRPGIEVLVSDSAHLVAGRRLALLSNQTGVDRAGRRDVDLLRADTATRLIALYSPEHGFRGRADALVHDTVDRSTDLPIYSLYSGAQPSPQALAALDRVDLVLIDLQDVGARYYTYAATAVVLMRAAAHRHKPVLVLDRPNPLGGVVLQGNVRAAPAPLAELVGVLPVPMRHGLTMGELLALANDRLALHATLTVVPAAGWRRGMTFGETGLPWIAPSPALPDLASVLLYPGLCLFEGTNLSVGRGTPWPFELVAAPWLDPAALLARLGRDPADSLPGVLIRADTVRPARPGDGKFPDRRLPALRLTVTDPARVDPPRVAVAILAALLAVERDSLRFDAPVFDRLAAGPALRDALERGATPAAIWAAWAPALDRFRRARLKYLLY